jgi:transcriptional regulator GlxA family with amidase domain
MYQVGILVFEGVEILDFAGPFEVFASARIDGDSCFEVSTIGLTTHLISTYGGLSLLPKVSIGERLPFDLLIIPGGYGIDQLLENTELRSWLDFYKNFGTRIASVCTGAFLLAAWGYLDGLEITTHHGDLESLKALHPKTNVLAGVRFIDQGQFLTSGGVSAGIDLSLYLVEQFCGKAAEEVCKNRMEWYFEP